MKRGKAKPLGSPRRPRGAKPVSNDHPHQVALKRYPESRGNSGIMAYATGTDFIVIQFKTGGTYLYTAASTGAEKIEAMKKLAASNDGLNTYISQYVRENYAAKLR